MYRAPAVESFKAYVVGLLTSLTCGAYELAYCAEESIHRQVMAIVSLLRDPDRDPSKSEQLKRMENKQERKAYGRQLAEQRLQAVNELQLLIPQYTDTMLAYLRAWQAVATNLEAALYTVREIRYANNNNHNNSNNLISLQSTPIS